MVTAAMGGSVLAGCPATPFLVRNGLSLPLRLYAVCCGTELLVGNSQAIVPYSFPHHPVILYHPRRWGPRRGDDDIQSPHTLA